MAYTIEFIERLEQEARDARNQLELANEVADKWQDKANELQARIDEADAVVNEWRNKAYKLKERLTEAEQIIDRFIWETVPCSCGRCNGPDLEPAKEFLGIEEL